MILRAGAPGTWCQWLGQRVSGLHGLLAKGIAVIRGAIIRNYAMLPLLEGIVLNQEVFWMGTIVITQGRLFS